MKYGYARRSRKKQTIETQKEILAALGAEVIIEETAAGKTTTRKEYRNLIDNTLEEGDELLATELSRLGRNALELLSLREKLADRGVTLTVEGKTYDFTNRTDRLTYGLQAVIYENESENNSDRVKRAIAAKGSGPKGGRPRALTDTQETWVWKRLKEQGWSISRCVEEYKCSRNSILRAVAKVDTRRQEEAKKAGDGQGSATAGDVQ